MDDLILNKNWLVENPTPRVPICLCLDRSPSMSGRAEWGAPKGTIGVPINELNEGVKIFFNSIKDDEIAKYSAEISIVVFSGTSEKILDFDYIENIDIPEIELETTYGGTSIGSAVEEAIKSLEKRKEEYKNVGVDYYQPWLVLMTDGEPTDDTHIGISKKVRQMVKENKLTVFPIGIGDGADMKTLEMFSPNRPPLKLKGLNFKDFFVWLSQSVSKVSQSNPGEKVELDTEKLKGWAEI